MDIQIGMDVEFMATRRGKYAFPVMDEDLSHVGCDEFGHCIEIRPGQSSNKEELLFNVISAINKLPDGFRYHADNVVTVDEQDFSTLLRTQGRKDVPTCENIYDNDILKTTDLEKKAMLKNTRLLYCGMHIHVSTSVSKIVRSHDEHGHEVGMEVKTEVPINYRTLTRMFDVWIFKTLEKDDGFAAGRYRSPGFYELKSSSHFEYRSLGVSAFTPQRVSIIFDMVKTIIDMQDILVTDDNYDFYTGYYTDMGTDLEELIEYQRALAKTRPSKKDLKSLWVPWK